MAFLTRVVVAILALTVIGGAGYVLLGDSTTAVAIRQWFVGIVRSASEPLARWLGRTARRTATRQGTRALTRVAVGVGIGLAVRYSSKRFVYPKIYWVDRINYRFTQAFVRPLKSFWNWKPGFPRWARACIALVVGACALWLCIEVSHAYGETWKGWTGSLLFSIVVFWIVEKLPWVGFDAVIAIASERWRGFKAWRARHPRFDAILGVITGQRLNRWFMRKLTRTDVREKPVSATKTKEAA